MSRRTRLSYGAQRVLVNAHRVRNQMEYEAEDFIDVGLVASLTAAAEELAGLLADAAILDG